MRAVFLLAVLVSLVVCASPATSLADDSWDFEFVYPESASQGRTAIPDNSVRWYQLIPTPETLSNPKLLNQPIQYMEFEVNGLAHDAPMDISLILFDPYGGGLRLMDDAGDQHPLTLPGVDIVFTDTGIPLPGSEPIVTDTDYLPEGPGLFSDYYKNDQTLMDPNLPWYVIVIDDDSLAEGSFGSMTLRGVVPEPATLSLLALGAAALAARRRRS